MSMRMSVPRSCEIGQDLKIMLHPVCMGDYMLEGLGYGIGYVVQDDEIINYYAWKKFSGNMQCNADTWFTIPVTQGMYDKQAQAHKLFVYVSDGHSKRVISGAGTCRTSGFAVTKPGIIPVPGRVRVAKRIRLRGTGSSSNCRTVAHVYVDQYEGGLLTYANYDYGSTCCHPCRVYSPDLNDFWTRWIHYMRKSLYDSLSVGERDWLDGLKGFWVVPNNWTPSDGTPYPTCKPTGAFTECPSSIPITFIPNWGPHLEVTNLPVTLDLSVRSCTDVFGDPATPPEIPITIPVTFSVDNVDIATMIATSSTISVDLMSSVEMWSKVMPIGAQSIMLRAQTPTQEIDQHVMAAFSVEARIPIDIRGGVPDVVPTPTPGPSPLPPTPEGKRLLVTCRDGSIIYQEAFVDGAWIPSGEKCPEDIAKRTLIAAVPKIMYAGQAIDIVVGAYIGAAASTNETAILTIDGVEVDRMNTKAGEVKFRWTAEGVGMHNLCITIPANVNLPTPGHVCKTIMVSADVGSIKEQVKKEMDSYSDELAMLRKKKQLAREELKKYVAPGRINVPASLAGSIIEIGGVIMTVPPEGMTIPIPAGDHQIVVVIEGIRKLIPVIVLPGEEVMLP